MYKSLTKKLTLWIAFLSLLLLAGCTGKQEETTVAQTEATTETAKKEVSLDGKWKIYNLRESLESILIYYNSVNQLNGSLIMLFAAEKGTIASELTINGNTAEYHGAYDMNISFEGYYDSQFDSKEISKEEGLKRYQSYVEILFKKFPDAVGGLSEDKQTLDGTIKNGKVDTQAKTITFTAPIFFAGDIRATPAVLSEAPVTYSYSIENDILTLTVSGSDSIYNFPITIVLQFQKVQE
mgnify:FL=1